MSMRLKPHENSITPISGKRFAFAFLSWLFAIFGVIGSVLAFFVFASKFILWFYEGVGVLPLGMYAGFMGEWLSKGSSLVILFPTLVPIYAWVALFVMTRAWLRDRKCSPVLVISGAAAGVASAVAFSEAFLTYALAVPLALHLTKFHLSRVARRQR